MDDRLYQWSETLGEVVDPRGAPVIRSPSPDWTPRPGSRARSSRPGSRQRGITRTRSMTADSRRKVSMEEQKERRIRKLEEVARRNEEKVEQLKREHGEEVREEVERRLQQMTMDDPGRMWLSTYTICNQPNTSLF